jgi:protein-tyrosine-phosphatase/tRNA A37 threonylcarbamoyladenosine synthetase subunit TsaC/SUA5/YrdC
MAEVLDWRRVDDVTAFARFAARALRRGYVMVFPTETGYVAAACLLRDEAVTRLLDVGDRPVELAVAADAVSDWLPGLGPAARRLARRFWPGPLTLACGEGASEGLTARLAPGIREQIQINGILHVRYPAHESLRETVGWLAGPVAMRAIPSGSSDAFTARQALDSAEELCNLVIDDGTCRHRQSATLVEAAGSDWTVTRAGVLSEELIRQQMATLIVFVCTGNTCRSPLAESICKKALADRLACQVEELPARGYRVISAGMAAVAGMPAADEAVAVAGAFGADLSGHASRSLTAELAGQADHLFVMTGGHLHALRQHLGASAGCLLSPDGEEIDDPIGQPREVYESCAAQMRAHIESRVAEILGRV